MLPFDFHKEFGSHYSAQKDYEHKNYYTSCDNVIGRRVTLLQLKNYMTFRYYLDRNERDKLRKYMYKKVMDEWIQ